MLSICKTSIGFEDVNCFLLSLNALKIDAFELYNCQTACIKREGVVFWFWYHFQSQQVIFEAKVFIC